MEQIDSGVDVAVVVSTAVSARPEPVGQREVMADITTDTACFRGRIEAVRAQDLRPVPFGLVLTETTEHTPPAVRYALRKPVISEHPRHVQVFQTYDAVLSDKPV